MLTSNSPKPKSAPVADQITPTRSKLGLVLATALGLSTLYTSSVQAAEGPMEASSKDASESVIQRPRLRLVLNGSHTVSDDMGKVIKKASVEWRVVPSFDLIDAKGPIGYLGTRLHFGGGTSLKPSLGWFSPNQLPFFSLAGGVNHPHFLLNAQSDIGVDGRGYNFANFQYKPLPWLMPGVETEHWGNYKKPESWSHGVGPNLILKYNRLALALALHARKQGGNWTADPSIRVMMNF